MSAALAGVRVLDLSRVLAGPWATQNLADLGADVIKIERPGVGDDTRGWGPPFARDADGEETSESAYFLSANRNKRSVTLDLAHPEGQRIVRELAADSDVLVENYKVGGLKRYGLDYESLRASCPRLIYCSISGFGQTGPYANRPGYDFLIQAMGGLMSVTGRADGEAGAGPQKVGVALVDILTGMYATSAITAALYARMASGLGQYIDLSLLDVQVACLGNQALNYLSTGRAPRRMGNGHPNIVPYQDFETADGNVIIAVGNDSQFRALCAVLERADLGAHPDYASNAMRVAKRAVLVPLLNALTRAHRSAELLARLETAGVPSGPVNDLEATFDDPQVKARSLRLNLPHASAGTVPSVASPLRLSGTPVQYRRAPPMLGEHTAEVLAERLGLNAQQLDALGKAGVI